MNARILELAEQAEIVFGFDKNGDPEVICSNMDIEKFAELIVRECLEVCHAKTLEYSLADECAEDIKEHFGIK